MSEDVNPASDPSLSAEERLAALGKQQEKSKAAYAENRAEEDRLRADNMKTVADALRKRQKA